MKTITILFLLLAAFGAQAAVQHRVVEYTDGDTKLKGHLYWDDAVQGRRPGVLVVHEWWGLDDYAQRRARMLAELGYVAFAADMYGDGRVTDHAEDAAGWMKQITANQEAWRRRALKGLEVLREDPHTDPQRLAAIGYCFGGATVMQLAYAGADLDLVVSFHGSLPPASPEEAARIRAVVLVEHGAADPFVPADRIEKFRAALDAAGVDWTLDLYGGVRHSFTNPAADRRGMEALRYDARADRRSWQRMRDYLAEVFGGG